MQSGQVAALRVADEAFLVATTIERCPKIMMLRELFMNAVEAALQANLGEQVVELRAEKFGDTRKLCIWNAGPGLSSYELYDICNLAASIGKEKGLDGNFGMGAKVASLPSNRFGLRYRSCKDGSVSEVVLCERDGIYGRLRREDPDGSFDEVRDVTQVCREKGQDTSSDWTEVTLLGNSAEQDTVRNPYDSDPEVAKQWIADHLYHRFFRVPPGLVIKLLPGTHKLDGHRYFKTISERAYPMGRHGSVQTDQGVIIHYFYDPPYRETSHNSSFSGSISTDVSTCAIVFRDEFYDVIRGRQWTLDAPMFGVTFGAKHISVHIELPSEYSVRPEAYRQFLRYRKGDQLQVYSQDFCEIVLENRPCWLIDLINALSPSDVRDKSEIRDELQKLLNSLRVRSQIPKISASGDISAEQGPSSGGRILRETEGGGLGNPPRSAADDLLAAPSGSKKAALALNAERAPTIVPLHGEHEIDEKALKGKAARYYPQSGQLFINMLYPSVDDMRKQLESEYATAPDLEWMRKMAVELAERTITLRVGRAIVYSLAKQMRREWTVEDIQSAQSPESLSLAADDFLDALQNARRRMGQVLRTGRQDNDEL